MADLHDKALDHSASNEAAEKAAKATLKGRMQDVTALFQKEGLDLIMVPREGDTRALYESLGYYHLKVTQEYIIEEDRAKNYLRGTGSYSGTIDSNGNVTLSEGTTTETGYETKELKRDVSEHRMVKLVKKGTKTEVSSLESQFLRDKDSAKAFFELKKGVKTAKPEQGPFVLYNLFSILALLSILGYYLFSQMTKGTFVYWDGTLLSGLINGLGAFVTEYNSLRYVMIGVLAVSYLLSVLIFWKYINKFVNVRYNPNAGILVLLMRILFLVAVGQILHAELLVGNTVFLYHICSLSRVIALIFIGMSLYYQFADWFGGVTYYGACYACGSRSALEQDPKAYEKYEELEQRIASKTVMFNGCRAGHTFVFTFNPNGEVRSNCKMNFAEWEK